MTRLMRRAIVVTVSMIALAGCSVPDPTPGPFHKWFNPDGVEVSAPAPDRCSPDEVAGLPAVAPPLSVPPGVAEGYSFARIDLRVEALIVSSEGPNPVTALCIPVAVHAYVSVGGTNAPITTVDQGVVSTPWDALRNTPYEATGLLAWKTSLPAAPVVNIDWSAKYEHMIDSVDRGDKVIGLACSVFVNGVVISRTISVDVNGPAAPLSHAQGGQGVTGPFVQCRPAAFTPRAAL